VRALSRDAIACGADGLVIESHCQPDMSVSDAAQAITPDTLKQIVLDTAAIYQALNLRDQDKPVVSSCEPVVLR
jgi:3-deoxy-D-arabino-heptulosonate 7-phosphate (DAHP) synthase